MSSYHSSFTYKERNSLDEGYIIVAFEPDTGFKETFLSMENISDEYYDGTKRFNYGARYSSSPEVKISIIKKNGTDISLKEFRECAKWLTGARIDSWLDMYVGDTIIYSFLGKFLNMEQYKYDARTTGVRLTFASVSPWAFSSPKMFDCEISQLLKVTYSGILNKVGDDFTPFGCTDEGIVFLNSTDENSYFNITDYDTVYLDNAYRTIIDNKSDDLYTYIYLDIDYKNGNGSRFSVKNVTLNEESIVTGISENESIYLSAKQFITSDIPNKIFGDDFNFVWPRLQPGLNNFVIEGDSSGYAEFTYRYPMKIGDCTMDIDVYGNGFCCGDCYGDGGSAFDGTISWENITDTPKTLKGYGITDAYTMYDVDDIARSIEEASKMNSGVTTTIVLLATNWVAVDDMYSQVVTIKNIARSSRVNLYPSAEQITQLQDEEIALVAENDNGIVTIYAIGGKPSVNYEIQAFVSDVPNENTELDVYIDEKELNDMLADILG